MTEQKNEGAPKVQFSLQRLYVKDLSFETPQGVAAFKAEWKPSVNQEMSTKTAKIDENVSSPPLRNW